VLLTFQESAAALRDNVAPLGFELAQLEMDELLVIDAVRVGPAEVVSARAFDLDRLFIRLAAAMAQVGAQRVVPDTIEVLFSALGNEGVVRADLGRLFRWLKEGGREGQLIRFGIEEYVSDCVMILDHRVCDDIWMRRLRVPKRCGSEHGTNEYPFLITGRGLTVLPITSAGLVHGASIERVCTGMASLDEMLGGGVYPGTTVMISGSAGTGKTNLAVAMLDVACGRGERALFVSFEESVAQVVRNVASAGIDLGRWAQTGLSQMWSEWATAYGLESHLERLLDDSAPSVVALDAIASLSRVGSAGEVASAVARELDLIKARRNTGVVTTLTHDVASSTFEVSSLIDTCLLLRNVESDAERRRLWFVIKSRGTEHSNKDREFVLTKNGAQLVDVSVGPAGVVTGSARAALEAAQRDATAQRRQDVEARRAGLARRSVQVDGQVAVSGAQFADEAAELDRLIAQQARREDLAATAHTALVDARGDGSSAQPDHQEDQG